MGNPRSDSKGTKQMDNLGASLENYYELVSRVDELCRRITADYAERLACREGCDDCCRHITLFPVEAVALASALGGLPPAEVSRIRERAASAVNAEPCPLLEEGRCLLYAARPVICRTHGFPLVFERKGDKVIDFCTKNFSGIKTFPASFVIDLDLLNATLAAINNVFLNVHRNKTQLQRERLSIAEALLLEL